MNKNIDVAAYKDAIILFLQEKYNDNFDVVSLYQEFDGNTGMKVRALCSKAGSRDQFSVYCYFDSSTANEKIYIDGNEHSIVDSYAEVLYQNALLSEINIAASVDSLVRCKVSFNSEQPSKSNMVDGMDFCLQNQEFDPYVKFYIFVSRNSSASEVQSAVEDVLNLHRPCTGYIYIAYFDEFSKDAVLGVYKEHQNDFGNYLTNTAFAEHVEFVLYKNDTGLQDKQTIRE